MFGVGFVALWELVVRRARLKPYFLPAAAIWSSSSSTTSARCGTRHACPGERAGRPGRRHVLGIACQLPAEAVPPLLNELLTPLAIALNAVPIIVLVAVLNNMFAHHDGDRRGG